MVSVRARTARRWADWRVVTLALVAMLGLLAWFTRQWWLPSMSSRAGDSDPPAQHHGSERAGHDHGDSTASLVLSERGLKNIGFQPVTVSLGSFERTISLPAIVAEKPGQTQIYLASPVGGVLTEIHVVQGEAIMPGSKMFDVRLTHEELVAAQQELLRTAERLEVVDREIARLESIGEGVVAGRRVLEQQYEKQQLEASLQAGRQALLLHGLNEEQVTEILKTRQLIQSLSVFAPDHSHAGSTCQEEHTFHVQRLPVSPGQQVQTSQELAVLADHCELYIEGRAFEDDAAGLREATRQGWTVSATLMSEDEPSTQIEGLKLLYLADAIDPESRAFPFYLRLPNAIVLDQTSDNHRFIEWRFKPGQRLELRVPVDRWDERIVLPVDAVVDEGAEAYVYRQNGDAFERVAVHVEYRDSHSAAIANDGAVFPGDIVAGRGAYEMHLALKNQAGGGVDPHAGHNH